MKTIILAFLIFSFAMPAFAQFTITGKVTDDKKAPVTGANVYLKNTLEGTSSDASGSFSLKTKKTGEQTLVVSFIGFVTFEKKINLSEKLLEINVQLQDNSSQINTVTVTAGAFEASDNKRGTVLKPLDIVTTAFGLGDIYGAINTLPGTQKVGEKGELFVRGGESYEARTFIDGMLVQKPYSSNMPDMPSRGRFSPFMFNGTLFSSGGYSAEYGQALSSALILTTEGLAAEDQSSISLMSIGGGAGHTKRWKNASLSVSADYTNLSPYFNLVPQKTDWVKMPEDIGGTVIFRTKTGKNSLLKVYGSFTNGRSVLNYPDFSDEKETNKIDLRSRNTYLNVSHKAFLSDKWSFNSGISYSDDLDKTRISANHVKDGVRAMETKFTAKYDVSNHFSVKFGHELNYRKYKQNYFDAAENQNYPSNFEDANNALFAEAEFSAGTKWAGRIGARAEHSGILNHVNIAPRASLAYKTSKYAQLSAGYGLFSQTPLDKYLRFTHTLLPEMAAHYILNYQWMKNDRIFRVEGYYKDYQKLVKYDAANMYLASAYNNSGNGFSRGVDIFYRDQKSLKNTDFWISYSLLDTKRNYQDFPVAAVPSFVSKHNLSTVYKRWLSKLNTQLSLSYVYSSGRTYRNPNNPQFLADKTEDYHDVSLAFSHLTTVFGNYTIVYFSINNLLGTEHVYGYNYSTMADNTGHFKGFAITPSAKRFLFLGIFISIK
jgi:vitamin B12 transporter